MTQKEAKELAVKVQYERLFTHCFHYSLEMRTCSCFLRRIHSCINWLVFKCRLECLCAREPWLLEKAKR
jgi:hypothetical protein